MASKEEIKNLSQWTANLWRAYQRTLQTKLAQEDINQILEDVKQIWLESGENELIQDMSIAFLEDIDRRAKQCTYYHGST